MIDKIFSMIFVIAIVLIGSVVLYISVFKGYEAEQTIARQEYEQEYSELLVHSLLLSHEEESGATYESLLAISLREVNTTVQVNGAEIDVEQEFTQALDALVGNGNYYFELKPQVKGVSISYILDGSPTMADKRAEVNERLPQLREDLQALFGPDAVIVVHLYILAGADTPLQCPLFTMPEGTTCTDLAGEAMYTDLILRGFSPPAPFPYRSYGEWLSTSHAAETQHMSESDWASAAAYASYQYQESDERFLTSKHVVIVVADELSSNSKADACMGLPENNVRGEVGSTDMFFCFLCNSTCPYDRAAAVVRQAQDVLTAHGDLFLGFYSLPCSYTYTPNKDLELTPYLCNFLDDQQVCSQVKDQTLRENKDWRNPAVSVNWCDQQRCGGCTRPDPWEGTYCYHSNCNDAVIRNLTSLSAVTGGFTADLTSLEMLTEEVYAYFEKQQATYDFSIGEQLDRDRFIVERPFTLSNGRTITLSFWLYD